MGGLEKLAVVGGRVVGRKEARWFCVEVARGRGAEG